MECLKFGLEDQNFDIRISGSNPNRAGELARAQIEAGCSGLISFGVAGAIDPSLNSGDLIVADQILTLEGGVLQTSNQWRSQFVKLAVGFENVFTGPMFGIDFILKKASQKKEIFSRTSALAVDMESHQIGRVANDNCVPFLVVRAILDSAIMDIPESAINIIDYNGKPKLLSILLKLIKRPEDFSKLFTLSRSHSLALASLQRASFIASLALRSK